MHLRPVMLSFVAALFGGVALAENLAVGLYVMNPEGAARIVMPAGATLRQGEAVEVLLPEIGGDALRRGAVTPGDRAEVTETDRMTVEAPVAWSVTALSAEDYFGIAVPGLAAGAAPDIDGNGIVEVPLACTSAESVQLALTEGSGDALRLVWHVAVYLGYDTEPTCTDAFFAAVERAM